MCAVIYCNVGKSCTVMSSRRISNPSILEPIGANLLKRKAFEARFLLLLLLLMLPLLRVAAGPRSQLWVQQEILAGFVHSSLKLVACEAFVLPFGPSLTGVQDLMMANGSEQQEQTQHSAQVSFLVRFLAVCDGCSWNSVVASRNK